MPTRAAGTVLRESPSWYLFSLIESILSVSLSDAMNSRTFNAVNRKKASRNAVQVVQLGSMFGVEQHAQNSHPEL